MLKISQFTYAAGILTLLAVSYPSTCLSAIEPHPSSSNAPALVSISREPFEDQQAKTLRWSPDSAEVAWMHLVRPSQSMKAEERRGLMQQEIWAMAAHGTSPGTPTLLIPAEKVNALLRASGPPIHIKPDEEEDKNPYLLQDVLWSNDHASLLLIGLHSLTWFELSSGKATTLISGNETLADVTLSPNGKTVIFLRDHQMWMVGAGGKAARVLTSPPPHHTQGDGDRQDGILEGEPDWPYRNEFHLARGYWWSPDSTQIAYLELDDRKVDKYTLRASDGSSRDIVYPKPGGNLPVARVFVKRVSGAGLAKVPLEIQLGNTTNFYLPRIQWLPDGRHLTIQRLNRRQQTLELLLADTQTGKVSTLLTEKDQYWINLSDDLRFLSDSKRFVWSSERNGFRHLYVYDMAGQQLAQLTHGDWEVTSVDAIDQTYVYMTGTEKSPLERHLYRVQLDPNSGAIEPPTRISQQAGTHSAYFAPDAASWIDIFSRQNTPPRAELLHEAGQSSGADAVNPAPPEISGRLETGKESKPSPPLGRGPAVTPDATPAKSAKRVDPPSDKNQPVEFLDLKLHQGMPVHALMIKPPAFDAAQKYPVIVWMAGGPQEQFVRDAWAGPTGMWMQLMARNGYIVFALDNQGTAGRGHYFEEPIHLRLGGMELADQRDGLTYLASLPYVDTDRLGVCGWGYGGFLTVHAMLDRPVPFKAGFAEAAVTDWHDYDAIFGERYLDDPVAYADGWDASTAIENAQFMKGALLLAQGTTDEFVHIENTLTLEDELVDHGKSADLLLLPDRGHQIEDPPARLVLFTHMTDFFIKNL